MNDEVILITGASSEVGHELIKTLSNDHKVVGLDINPIDEGLQQHLAEFVQADILDTQTLDR